MSKAAQSGRDAFERVTQVIDRTQEFFTEDEPSKKIGHAPQSWAAARL